MEIHLKIRIPDKELIEDPVSSLTEILSRLHYQVFDVICSEVSGARHSIFPAKGPAREMGKVEIYVENVSKKFKAKWGRQFF